MCEFVPSVPEGLTLGNTNIGSDLLQKNNALYNFCFTINNYNNAEVEDLKDFCAKCAKIYIVGDEIGESQTPHLQGFVKLLKKSRFSTLKNRFCFKRAHIEKCKGNDKQNIDYCSKEKILITNVPIKREVKVIENLYPWQEEMEKLLTSENDDRTVHWIYDINGNNGKSQFMKYMIKKHKCIFCCGGKRNDILNLCYNQKEYLECANPAIIIWDLPRDICDDFICYDAIECLKNGIVVNMKYETGGFIINSPNILILSNKKPQMSKLTQDRWAIYEIDEKFLKKIC